MLIVRKGTTFPQSDEEIREWLSSKKVAVPGRMTSAYLALQLFMENFGFAEEVVAFDEIFAHVQSGRSDVGLIIHEGQLTYGREGFDLVLDLGAWWKRITGLPLPLGGNVIRKDFSPETRSELNVILKESIRYGLEHRAAGVEHAMPLARGMDTELADRFIGMYVNDFTMDYGEVGRSAIRAFLGRAHQAGLIPNVVDLEFVE
jgi:1,4-dihydroxy-6-naphthoate synthase